MGRIFLKLSLSVYCLLGILAIETDVGVFASMDKVEIVLYQRGKQVALEPRCIPVIASECEKLFTEADDTMLLIITSDRIQRIKQKEVAIEVLYPSVQTQTIIGRKVHFTKLLIPLSGQFSDGMVFFAGSARPDNKELDFTSLQNYGSTNYVRNSRGIMHFKGIFNELRIKVD